MVWDKMKRRGATIPFSILVVKNGVNVLQGRPTVLVSRPGTSVSQALASKGLSASIWPWGGVGISGWGWGRVEATW